jgi:hypothetical protein
MWGLHLAYQRPVGDSGLRVGSILTANLLSHPKLPSYEIERAVQAIPWDPGHSAAYNIGVGMSQSYQSTTFGIDAIYEPILSHTWGEAPSPLQTVSGGTIPTGGKTTENQFRFSNGILRTGVSQDVRLDGVEHPLRVQFGIGVHAIHYWLEQFDHVQGAGRSQEERWMEWTRTWGLSLRLSDLEVRYLGRSTSGTGRPGVAGNVGRCIDICVADAAVATAGNVIAAPTGPLTLTDIRVTTHQISFSLPLR